MPITIEDLQETVASLYTSTTYITADNKTVVLKLDCGGYRAHVSLTLDSQFQTGTERQAIGISFVFMEKDGKEYTVNHLDAGVIARFCIEQQMKVDWGSLEIHPESDDDQVVVLYRIISTSKTDLELARNRDFASQLHTALFHLPYEFEDLAPSVISMATCKPEHAEQTRAMLAIPIDSILN